MPHNSTHIFAGEADEPEVQTESDGTVFVRFFEGDTRVVISGSAERVGALLGAPADLVRLHAAHRADPVEREAG
ncbi:hypothetical protein ER308_07325 [Egibacter rhizosphaerae]|uniref:Uncharacterized protein n=1 Tax=Egibacter rhizosphaerae TaxID=1670831 RepID=A0A411YDW5_9ACTN|nr:hypothetical protein [Egibacter rhizosphaerae]QBI19376.1 hypothetical protein ER308_07325 [Egibacter rhizosphaerae]